MNGVIFMKLININHY